MKKVLISVLLICVCLFTGCTKNYKTVKEYSVAMNEVRTRLGDYTVEATISNDNGDTDCKTYKKGDLWKTEVSKNKDKVYNDGILYDGDEVYSYSKPQNVAMSMPFKQMLQKSKEADEKSLNMVMKLINPTGILFYWDLDDMVEENNDSWKFGKITKKNDFKCRMLTHKNGGEVCISDKYGIAVFAEMDTPNHGKVIINVKNISNDVLSDSDMGLPEGVKKMSMVDLFKSMVKMME